MELYSTYHQQSAEGTKQLKKRHFDRGTHYVDVNDNGPLMLTFSIVSQHFLVLSFRASLGYVYLSVIPNCSHLENFCHRTYRFDGNTYVSSQRQRVIK